MARTRLLTAIMFSRIEGFSSLLQKDESAADQLRDRFREIHRKNADKFNGKILRYPGSGTLTIYASAVEAVQSAIAMQSEFRGIPAIPVKIGIHLGEIIYSEDEAIGDGVEIATKMASRAIAGSILISGKIYDEIRKLEDIHTLFLQSCCLDESEEPLDMYAISNEGLVVPEPDRDGSEADSEDAGSNGKLLSFWRELVRRKVVRVITVYAASAYIILEFVDIVEDDLGLPVWTGKFLFILLSIGLVMTAILSWVYDITPEGIKKTKALLPGQQWRRKTGINNGGSGASGSTSEISWFRRNKVFKRYLLPVAGFAALLLVFHFWDDLFRSPAKLKRKAQAHVENAKIYWNNAKDSALAFKELDLALAIDSNCASAYNTYAMVYLEQGDTVIARQLLIRATLADSMYSMAWSNLALFAFRENNMDLALRYTMNAVRSDPSNKIAAYNMAIQCHDRDLFVQAEEWYERAISMDSLFIAAYSALGALYNDMDRPVEAILVLEKAMQIAPTTPFAYMIYKNMAEAHFILKQYDRALGYLEESKRLNPRFPETERCFARYYETMGDTSTSIRHWQQYLILEEDPVFTLSAQHHLDSLRNR